MSVWSRIRERLSSGSTESRGTAVQSGRPEDTGGHPDPAAADSNSSTGTTPNDTIVGRATGSDDPGYLETGAEKRAGDDEDDLGYGAAR